MRPFLPAAVVCCIFSLVFLPFITLIPRAQAAELTQAMVRLDRLKANTALSGLICATPSAAGAGTEGRVSVTFPSDFLLSTNTANWTTDTADIPVGMTAWPGISASAQSVSGTTVTFSSNDLTNGSTDYCFTFTAAASITGSSGSKTATITTGTAGGTTIDSRVVGLTVGNDRIGVTAAVAAKPTDFSAILTRVTPRALFGQDQEIVYQLAYSSLLAYPATSVSLEAAWSAGTISGSGIPTVELLEYVPNSASTAYNSTPPVIDPVNHTITWTIGTLPTGANGTVQFTLKTNNTYRGSADVTFDASGRMLGPGTATPYSTVTSTYRYNFNPPTTPGPTGTPGPTTPTPTPSTRTRPFTVQNVEIRSLTSDGALIDIALSDPGTVSVAYGTSPAALTEQLNLLNTTRFHTLTFSELTAATPYYFRITARDKNGRRLTSDLYTFTTALLSSAPKISPDTFIATSDKNLLFTFLDRRVTNGVNFIIIPTSMIFETQFAFPEETQIKNILLIARNKNILGSNTFIDTVEAATDKTPLLEIKPGVFTGRLRSNSEPGYYELYARIADFQGNLTEEKISDMKVSKPFLITAAHTEKPVENAKVTLYHFNDKNRTYEYISPQLLPIRNPLYSDATGRIPVVLPIGRYRAEIDHVLFEEQSVDFTIGMQPGEDYPTVHLTPAPFSLLRSVRYITGVLIDIVSSLTRSTIEVSSSSRLFDLLGVLTVTTFLLLTLLALSHRTHVRLTHLPRYIHSLLTLHRADTPPESRYMGIIRDGHSKQVLSDVDVFVADVDTGKVLFHTKSNKSGKFSLTLPTKYIYLVTLEKLGYHPATLHMHHLKKGEEQQLALLETEEVLGVLETFHRLFTSSLGFSFEILLLLSFVSAVLLSFSLGFIPVAPFLLLALFNLIFWMLHEVHIRQ
jgi:hypothetical protein